MDQPNWHVHVVTYVAEKGAEGEETVFLPGREENSANDFHSHHIAHTHTSQQHKQTHETLLVAADVNIDAGWRKKGLVSKPTKVPSAVRIDSPNKGSSTKCNRKFRSNRYPTWKNFNLVQDGRLPSDKSKLFKGNFTTRCTLTPREPVP